jgi:hypothetical protein
MVYRKIRATVIILIFSNVFISCCLKNDRSVAEYKKVKLVGNLPLVYSDGQVSNIIDSIYIVYHNNDILFKMPYTYTFENEDTILWQEERFNYFVYRDGERFGCYYDSTRNLRTQKREVDTVLKYKTFGSKDLYEDSNSILVDAKRNVENYPLVEKYVLKTKPDFSYPDTMLFFYTNSLKDIKFSLSNTLEKLKKRRVTKVRFLYNSQYYTEFPIKFPQREFRFELAEEPLNDVSEIALIFERYRKDKAGEKK